MNADAQRTPRRCVVSPSSTNLKRRGRSVEKFLVYVLATVSLTCLPLTHGSAQTLDIAGISIGLGEPAQDVLRRFSNSFTIEYSAVANGYSIRSGASLYGSFFIKNERVISIRKNFSPNYEIGALARATAAAYDFVSGKVSISNCFITNRLEGNVNSMFIRCGPYSLTLMLSAINSQLLYQVFVDLTQ